MVLQQVETRSPSTLVANFDRPVIDDGQDLWRIARDSKTLDLNSSYAYMLWCRDFADTTIVASVEGTPVGFITAYTRPEEPETLFVWQVAVDESFRGQKLSSRMLDKLVALVPGTQWVETTITDDNEASIGLFSSFALRRETQLDRRPLFERRHFPDGHDTEFLFRIGPFS